MVTGATGIIGIVEPDFNGGIKGGTLGLKIGTDSPYED